MLPAFRKVRHYRYWIPLSLMNQADLYENKLIESDSIDGQRAPIAKTGNPRSAYFRKNTFLGGILSFIELGKIGCLVESVVLKIELFLSRLPI